MPVIEGPELPIREPPVSGPGVEAYELARQDAESRPFRAGATSFNDGVAACQEFLRSIHHTGTADLLERLKRPRGIR